jgi:hypothetical protein
MKRPRQDPCGSVGKWSFRETWSEGSFVIRSIYVVIFIMSILVGYGEA